MSNLPVKPYLTPYFFKLCLTPPFHTTYSLKYIQKTEKQNHAHPTAHKTEIDFFP